MSGEHYNPDEEQEPTREQNLWNSAEKMIQGAQDSFGTGHDALGQRELDHAIKSLEEIEGDRRRTSQA